MSSQMFGTLTLNVQPSSLNDVQRGFGMLLRQLICEVLTGREFRENEIAVLCNFGLQRVKQNSRSQIGKQCKPVQVHRIFCFSEKRQAMHVAIHPCKKDRDCITAVSVFCLPFSLLGSIPNPLKPASRCYGPMDLL